MTKLSDKDKALVDAVLQTMAEDLAEIAEVYGLGACMVRVLWNDGRLILTAKAHSRQVHGLTAPDELSSFREVRAKVKR